jgi:polysaccharide biosynthesis protein PslH
MERSSMKILYICHRIPYPPNKGDKIRSFNEIKHLSKNHDLYLAFLVDDPTDVKHVDALKEYCVDLAWEQINPRAQKVKAASQMVLGKPLSLPYFYSSRLQQAIDHWAAAFPFDTVLCFSGPMAEYVFRSKALKVGSTAAPSCEDVENRGTASLVGSAASPPCWKNNKTSELSERSYKMTRSSIQQGACGADHARHNVPISQAQRSPKLIMDFCDVDSDKWGQYAVDARFPMSFVYRLEQKRLLAYEAWVNREFDRSIFITENEAALFKNHVPDAGKLAVVGNGVDFEFFKPVGSTASPSCEDVENRGTAALVGSAASPPCWKSNKTSELSERSYKMTKSSIPQGACGADPTDLVFTGAMDYHANVDAVVWFCQEILPLIREAGVGSEFCIVGGKPTADVQALGRLPGVKVTGFVDDIRPWYARAAVSVIPLRLARGVQNKVLEAMAMGRPVVTTRKAAEGVGAKDMEHLIVADGHKAFAGAVIDLYKDAAARQQLGEAARRFVVENFDWQRNMEKLENVLLER